MSLKLAVNICFIINYKIKERGRGTEKKVKVSRETQL